MSVQRLNQALTFWEDLCALERFAQSLESYRQNVPFAPVGPLKYLGLRHAIQQRRPWSNEYVYEGTRPGLLATSLLPFHLHQWGITNAVFRLTPEIVEHLKSAHVPAPCTWKAFPRPFTSFAISFESAMTFPERPEFVFDTVLVTHLVQAHGASLLIQCLPINLDAHVALGEEELAECLRDVEGEARAMRERMRVSMSQQVSRTAMRSKSRGAKRWRAKMRAAVDQKAAELRSKLVPLVLAPMEQELRETIEEANRTALLMRSGFFYEEHAFDAQVELSGFQGFIFSLCDYLARGAREGMGTPSRVEANDELDITKGAQLFMIGSSVPLHKNVHAATQETRPGQPVRPHPRRGHYRRVRGSLPDAPKTQWVNPTWVHKELMSAASVSAREIVVDVNIDDSNT